MQQNICQQTKKIGRMGLVFACLLALSMLLVSAMPKQALADDALFQFGLTTDAESVSVGDTITIKEMLAKGDADAFTMYALTTYVSYDPNVLEYTGGSACELGTLTPREGSIVFNALSRVLAGNVWDSPHELASLDFEVIGSGDASLRVKRVMVSNETGMRSFSVTASGLSLQTGQAPEASDPNFENGSFSGDATPDDEASTNAGAFAENVKKDPLFALDPQDGLTPDAYKNLIAAGFDDQQLTQLGFTQEELDQAKNGENATSALRLVTDHHPISEDAQNTSVPGEKGAEASNGLPIVPIVGGLIVVLIAAIAGFVMVSRKRR